MTASSWTGNKGESGGVRRREIRLPCPGCCGRQWGTTGGHLVGFLLLPPSHTWLRREVVCLSLIWMAPPPSKPQEGVVAPHPGLALDMLGVAITQLH